MSFLALVLSLFFLMAFLALCLSLILFYAEPKDNNSNSHITTSEEDDK